jgi:hypothetical protein
MTGGASAEHASNYYNNRGKTMREKKPKISNPPETGIIPA